MSHIEYLIPTDNILVLLLYSIFFINLSLLASFQYDLIITQKWRTFYSVTLYIRLQADYFHNRSITVIFVECKKLWSCMLFVRQWSILVGVESKCDKFKAICTHVLSVKLHLRGRTDGQTDAANGPSVGLSRVVAMSTQRDGGDRGGRCGRACLSVRPSLYSLRWSLTLIYDFTTRQAYTTGTKKFISSSLCYCHTPKARTTTIRNK